MTAHFFTYGYKSSEVMLYLESSNRFREHVIILQNNFQPANYNYIQ